MAIFIPGIRCPLCGEVIESAHDAVMFPPFVSNEADPLFVFHDAAVHAECFVEHPLAKAAQVRYEEFRERTSPKDRSCFICGTQIASPDDYLAFGHLTDDPGHPLHVFNYAQFHRSCLGGWPVLAGVLRELEALDQSGTWKGGALTRLIEEIRLTQPKR